MMKFQMYVVKQMGCIIQILDQVDVIGRWKQKKRRVNFNKANRPQ